MVSAGLLAVTVVVNVTVMAVGLSFAHIVLVVVVVELASVSLMSAVGRRCGGLLLLGGIIVEI